MSDQAAASSSQRPRRGGPSLVLFIVAATAVVAWISWYGTSFKRELSDGQILELLQPGTEPREIQHALSQLEERLGPDHPNKEAFREPVVALASHPEWRIRHMVAWVMAREPADVYRQALARLLEDPAVQVRRQAALSLASGFNDPRARPVLLEALDPVRVEAPATGRLDLKVAEGEEISTGRPFAVIEGDGEEVEVSAPYNGWVRELPIASGSHVDRGEVVVVVSPDPQVLENVIVALRYVGKPEDLPRLAALAEGEGPKVSPAVRRSARQTIEVLERFRH